MTLKDAVAQLKAVGNDTVRARNIKNGAGDNQFGVAMGDIRKVAAKIDHFLPQSSAMRRPRKATSKARVFASVLKTTM